MSQSESISALSDALAKAQTELKNPHFDSSNPHFKSKFASLGAVREAVIPVFSKHGIALTQWPISREGAAGCRTVISHKGEWMAEDFLIPVDKHNAHGYASAVTYAKRISMQSIAAVVGDQDDDGNQAVGDNVKGLKALDAPGKGPSITPTTGAWESMSPDMQAYLSDLATRITNLVASGAAGSAYDEIEAQDWTDEMAKVALWSRLDSKTRSAIKKAGESRKQQKEAA